MCGAGTDVTSRVQVGVLTSVHASLEQEHALRHAMLSKRAKLTLDSLLTSPRLAEQGTQQLALQAAERALAALPAEAKVTLDQVFEATQGGLQAWRAQDGLLHIGIRPAQFGGWA